MRSFIKIFLPLLSVLVMYSCGYGFQSLKNKWEEEGIKTVSIPMFYNETIEGGAEVYFTNALRLYMMSRSGKLKLVRSGGDAELSGTVKKIKLVRAGVQFGSEETQAQGGIPAGRMLAVTYNVSDKISGKWIYDDFNVSIFLNAQWKPLDENALEQLNTGTVYKFRCEKQDFYTQTYSLFIAPYQRRLNLSFDLTPKPGILVFESLEASGKIKINGSTRYINSNGESVAIPSFSPGKEITFDLYAGLYNFSFEYKGVVDVIPIRVSTDAERKIKISWDANNEKWLY